MYYGKADPGGNVREGEAQVNGETRIFSPACAIKVLLFYAGRLGVWLYRFLMVAVGGFSPPTVQK